MAVPQTPFRSSCAAGGWYTEGVDRDLVFVVGERNGVWGTAMRAPGIASLDAGFAFLSSVSCVSAGSCAAGGSYTDASRHSQPFVVDERKGVWGRLMPVPGSASLNTGGYAGTNSVSCGSAGDCVAVGWYSGPRRLAFVARERKGVWGKAIPVPGLAALNNGGGSNAISASCPAAGNCAAGGWFKYGARSSHWQAFAVGLVNGRWAKARLIPGSAILNAGGRVQLSSVSCYSAGNCAAGGYYTDGSGLRQAFVVSQHSGVWGKAIPVPGLAALSAGGDADLTSVSCGPAGTCAAGGPYIRSGQQAFVVSRS